jgi:hypothetical protein
MQAHALSRGSPPNKNGVPWGNSAGTSYIRVIPVPSQIGIQNCAASYTDGFPPLTFLPAGAGGCPPFGQDMNGILNANALAIQWMFAGGTVNYDATFQTQIGGYPKDALVQSNILIGRVWRSTADNNLTNPDDQTGATVNWDVPVGSMRAGTLIATYNGGTAMIGAVYANGSTVGDASSNATTRANSDTYWLFSYLWSTCGSCGIFTSAGGGSTKTTIAADWAAHKQMATPDLRGTTVMGADNSSTRLTGVPVVSGSATATGSILGENLHTLTSPAEIPAHTHSPTVSQGCSASDSGHSHSIGFTFGGTAVGSPGGSFAAAGSTGTTTNSANITCSTAVGVTIGSTGSSGAHNTVPRSTIIFWYLQL